MSGVTLASLELRLTSSRPIYTDYKTGASDGNVAIYEPFVPAGWSFLGHVALAYANPSVPFTAPQVAANAPAMLIARSVGDDGETPALCAVSPPLEDGRPKPLWTDQHSGGAQNIELYAFAAVTPGYTPVGLFASIVAEYGVDPTLNPAWAWLAAVRDDLVKPATPGSTRIWWDRRSGAEGHGTWRDITLWNVKVGKTAVSFVGTEGYPAVPVQTTPVPNVPRRVSAAGADGGVHETALQLPAGVGVELGPIPDFDGAGDFTIEMLVPAYVDAGSAYGVVSLVYRSGQRSLCYLDGEPIAASQIPAVTPSVAIAGTTVTLRSVSGLAVVGETRIWARALAEHEIQSKLFLSAPPEMPELLGWYDFTTIPATDRSEHRVDPRFPDSAAAYQRLTYVCEFSSGASAAGAISETLTLMNDFTLEARVSVGSGQTIFAAAAPGDEIVLGVDSTGIPFLAHQGHVAQAPNCRIKWGVWTHLACVYDCVSGAVTFYVDGGPTPSVAWLAPTSTVERAPWLGASPSGQYRPLTGAIEEVRVWGVVRDAEQIAANLSTHPYDDPDILGYFAFDFPAQASAACTDLSLQMPLTLNGATITAVVNTVPVRRAGDTPSLRAAVRAPAASRTASSIRPRGVSGEDLWSARVAALALSAVLDGLEVASTLSDGFMELFRRALAQSDGIAHAFQDLVENPRWTARGILDFVEALAGAGALHALLWELIARSYPDLMRLSNTICAIPEHLPWAIVRVQRAALEARPVIAALEPLAGSQESDHLTIRMFQVGAGDAFLLTYRYVAGQTVAPTAAWNALVDAGNGRRPGVSSIFWQNVRRGLPGRLDVTCGTHADQDHIGGLLTLFQELAVQQPPLPAGKLAVGQLWLNAPEPIDLRSDPLYDATFTEDGALRPEVLELTEFDDDPRFELGTYQQLVDLGELATAKKIETLPVLTQTALPAPGHLQIATIGPQLYNWQRYVTLGGRRSSEVTNRTSIVLGFNSALNDTAGAVPLLLMTGDAYDLEQPDTPPAPAGWQKTDIRGAQPPPATLEYLFLKVPHHGSDVSEDAAFYANCTAQYYLISSGTRHRHPRPSTLQRIVESKQGRPFKLYCTTETEAVRQLAVDPVYGPDARGYELYVLTSAYADFEIVCEPGKPPVVIPPTGVKKLPAPVPPSDGDRAPVAASRRDDDQLRMATRS